LQLHRDFVHAGSDVVEALTYYVHREKLRLVGRENDLEKMNRTALKLAKQVATENGNDCLVAGNICNSNLWTSDITEETKKYIEHMFREQVNWAKEEGVDYIIAETMNSLGESSIALKVIKEAGLTAVITVTFHQDDKTFDNKTLEETFKALKQAGADVVGINCHRGPSTMLPLIKRVRAAVEGPIAFLPIPFRTNEQFPTMMSLRDDKCLAPQGIPFPTALDSFSCSRYEIAEYTKKALEIGVSYFGLCCGAGPHHIRSMAETLGKRPPGSKYSPDMSKHFALGNDKKLPEEFLLANNKYKF